MTAYSASLSVVWLVMHFLYFYLDSSSPNGLQFSLNCTNFTVEDFKLLNRLNTITAFICSVITLVILIYLICSTAFSSLLKRLYFYLIVATLFTEIVVALNIEHQWQYSGQETVCVWLGFLSQLSFLLGFVLSYEVIFHLLCVVVSQIRGSQPLPQYTRSRYCTITLEIVYIIFPLAMSIALSVPPYIEGLYGIAGPWCWVRALDEDCMPTGLVTQMLFIGMNMTVAITEIAGSIIFVIMYCKITALFHDARFLLKQTLYVMLFQIVHMLMLICNLSVRFHTLLTHRHQNYSLWVAGAFISPAGLLVFPLGYLLFFYPVKSNIMNIIYKVIKICKRRSLSSDWQVRTRNILTKFATAPKSNRITQPSQTYFSIPHPDNFTETSPVIISNAAVHDIA